MKIVNSQITSCDFSSEYCVDIWLLKQVYSLTILRRDPVGCNCDRDLDQAVKMLARIEQHLEDDGYSTVARGCSLDDKADIIGGCQRRLIEETQQGMPEEEVLYCEQNDLRQRLEQQQHRGPVRRDALLEDVPDVLAIEDVNHLRLDDLRAADPGDIFLASSKLLHGHQLPRNSHHVDHQIYLRGAVHTGIVKR
jgi:hypothetical protein